jgi:hypothetical protein
MLNGYYGKSSCKIFYKELFFASSGYPQPPQGTYLIRLKFKEKYKRIAGMEGK